MNRVASDKKVQGDLASFSIFDITQTLLAGRKSAYVTIESGIRRGYLAFEDGQIVHALDDQLDAGEKAVFNIFSWRRGSFTIDFETRPKERNVKSPTDFLMLEVARQIDEATHEVGGQGGTEEDVTHSMGEKLGASLKSKLTSIFKRVAERAEPTRDRYTRHAFDGLLGPLLEMRGSALFIRRGLEPRVKTAEGFVTLKDDVVDGDEIRGFLMATLSEREEATLREHKEVATLYDGGCLGTFRVSVFEEEGAPTILIAPALREIPKLDDFGLEKGAEALRGITDGVVLVAGSLDSGKSSLLASLVLHHVEQRDKFAIVYSTARLHAFPSGRGFVMQRPRPSGGADFAGSIQAALDQGADLLAVDPVTEAEELRTLLEVATTSRLVVASLPALSFGDTLARLQKATDAPSRDRILRLLGEALRAIVWLPTRRPMESPDPEHVLIGREEQALLRNGDFESLRFRHVVANAGQ